MRRNRRSIRRIRRKREAEFFLSRPFDGKRFAKLLEGLEITIRRLSVVKDEHLFFRLDAEHCQKAYLLNLDRIRKWPGGFVRLGTQLEDMTGGATPLGAEYPETGVRFLRVQNIMPGYIDDSDMAHITPADDKMLARSRLRTDDILLTITGVSYGKSAVVTPEFAVSNINQHSVRMHLRAGSFRPLFLATFLNARPGKLQSDQNITGITRPALDYPTIRNFAIPRVSDKFQRTVEQAVRQAHECLATAKASFANAEELLTAELGLRDWHPPEPLTYTRRASEAFAAQRLDAEHFQPKFSALIQGIRATGHSVVQLGEIMLPVKNGYDCRDFVDEGTPYIRVGDIGGCRIRLETAMRVPLRVEELGKDIALKVGDVLFTRKGSYGNAAPVRNGEQHAIISSEIMLIRRRDEFVGRVLPEFLAMFLNSIGGSFQAEQWAHGGAFYSISQEDLNGFVIPLIPMQIQIRLREKLTASEAAQRRARDLLIAAQHAVENAIERSEAAADQSLKVLMGL